MKSIAFLPGDGVGPEVSASAMAVLRKVTERFGIEFAVSSHPIGGAAIDATGEPLPAATLEACLAADAVFLGAVGGPRWDGAFQRPEHGLLALRKAMGVYANIRPLRIFPGLMMASPLRPELVAGVDLVIFRELTGGIYFGAKQEESGFARDECPYHADEIARIAHRAFAGARGRRGRVASVDKANVMATGRLWRRVVSAIHAAHYPDILLEHILVDAMAMHLVRRPADFDVILTENMFGDILSDEASAIAGSIGLAPSASLGDRAGGLFEPVHGSAPDIAGQDKANPIGAILSLAMLLEDGLGLPEPAARIVDAVSQTLADGARTVDLGGNWGCRRMSEAILARI